jgi:uncharacterized protein (TIGR02246 family)
MRFNLIFTLSAACLLTFTACRQAAETPADLAQIKTEIQALENAWAAALNTQDLDALMAMYADDAVSMPDNAPILVGKDAIRKQQEQEFAGTPAGRTYSFEVLDVYGDGNTVTETGKSTYKDAAGKVTGTGKYMVVWKKQGDKYLCIREIYNGDAPPPRCDQKHPPVRYAGGRDRGGMVGSACRDEWRRCRAGLPRRRLLHVQNGECRRQGLPLLLRGCLAQRRGLQKNPRGPGLDSRQRKIQSDVR